MTWQEHTVKCIIQVSTHNSSIILPVRPDGRVFVYELSVCGFESVTATETSKEFLDIQTTLGCGFNLKRVRDMIITCSQMHHTDKYSTQLNHLTSLAKWLSVLLQTKWLWVRIPLLSLKLQISRLFWVRIIDIQATTECRFTLKRVCDMTRTRSR